MNAVIEHVFGFVLETSAGACVVVCALVLVQRAFGRWLTPRARYLLWTVLLLRLMLPWTPSSPLSAANLLQASRAAAPARALIEATRLAPALDAASAPVETEPAPATTPSRVFGWRAGAKLAWLAGCLLWGVHVFVACSRLPRRLGDPRPLEDERALAVFARCHAEMGMEKRRVELFEARIPYPLVCGLIRPRMVLPVGAAENLTKAELRHVFLHELAHLKRADVAVGVLCAVLQALHWFNPLVWYAFRRMRQDREYACDSLALSHMAQGEASNYGRTLIKLVQGGSATARLAGAAGIAENKSELERRIRMIAKHASSKYRLRMAGFVLFAVCAAVFLTRETAQPVAAEGVPGVAEAVKRGFAEQMHVIEVESYQESWSAFRPGDSIEIVQVVGTAPDFKVGETYAVRGRYVLASEDRAQLHLYCTNGETATFPPGENGLVEKGEGEFTRHFRILKPGKLHVSFYPHPGGDGFGDTYFRKATVPLDSPDAFVDLATSDEEFELKPMENSTGYSLHVSVRNEGNRVSAPFDIWFSAEATLMRHGGGALQPGEVWREMTLPVVLNEGDNTFEVQIDPENRIQESDETNNTATLTVRGKKVVREVVEIEQN